jgi:adenylate cyclase
VSERQATVLFANLSGSAELYAAVGDTAAQAAVERRLDLAAQSVTSGGGRVVKRYGHGLMAIFGSPDAAATAAAETQARAETAPGVGGVQLGLRVGFHHGPVLQQGSDVFGDNVNLAARLASLAKKGEVVLSLATAGLLSAGLRSMVRNLYPITVKGKSEDVDLAELMWRSDAQATVGARPTPAPRPSAPCLRLEYRGQTIVRRRAGDSIGLGRDEDCGLVVDHEMVSRSHCTIERRQGTFVLKDHSTNGTYVTYDGDREVLLRRDELVLGKHGWLALGQPRAAAPDAVEFFCE